MSSGDRGSTALLRLTGVTRSQADDGLVTLEWLLIVAAVAGLAASTALGVQRVVDDASAVPIDPLVQVLDADIAAAAIAAEAQAVFDADPPNYGSLIDDGFHDRCVIDLSQDFDDVVEPSATTWASPQDPDMVPDTGDEIAARCTVTPKPNLAG